MSDSVCKKCAKSKCNACFTDGFTNENCANCMNQNCGFCIGSPTGKFHNKIKKTNLVGLSQTGTNAISVLAAIAFLILIVGLVYWRMNNGTRVRQSHYEPSGYSYRRGYHH